MHLTDKMFELEYLLIFYTIHLEKLQVQLQNDIPEEIADQTLDVYNMFLTILKSDFLKQVEKEERLHYFGY